MCGGEQLPGLRVRSACRRGVSAPPPPRPDGAVRRDGTLARRGGAKRGRARVPRASRRQPQEEGALQDGVSGARVGGQQREQRRPGGYGGGPGAGGRPGVALRGPGGVGLGALGCGVERRALGSGGVALRGALGGLRGGSEGLRGMGCVGLRRALGGV